MAKFFQKKYDCELFGIIDVNDELKKFFLKQNIVKFKKTFYIRDHIPKKLKKPDLKYLENFENKYKINLWQIAYGERFFSEFNEYYKFNHDELMSVFENLCKFFEKTIDEIKPDYLICKSTDLHRHHLLFEICKSQGIKILMLNPTRFGYRYAISGEYDTVYEFPNNLDTNSDKNELINDPKKYYEKFNTYTQFKKLSEEKSNISIWKIFFHFMKFLILSCNNQYRSFYDNYGMTRWMVLTKKKFMLSYYLKRRSRESFLNKNSTRIINNDILFVYFPLHVEPERTLLISTPFYTDQPALIKNIAKSLPAGYKLYVKEHVNMRSKGWRSQDYYKRIIDLPNVELIHPSVKSEDILKQCSLVTTIYGTTGLEAAFHEKPAIVFADMSYSYLPFVYRIQNLEDLPNAIRIMLQKKFDFSSLTDYIKKIDRNSFELDIRTLQNQLNNWFFYGGVIKDTEISVSKMNSFINQYQNEFERFALEYVKKIKEFKKYELQLNGKTVIDKP